jgi:hypothetical protein
MRFTVVPDEALPGFWAVFDTVRRRVLRTHYGVPAEQGKPAVFSDLSAAERSAERANRHRASRLREST